MFTCNLDPSSRTTLTEQLYTALRGDMERGSIRPGERMPSKRELAAHLAEHIGRQGVLAAGFGELGDHHIIEADHEGQHTRALLI